MKQIGFKNFRRFADFPAMDLAPITIFVGENNSGKSTVVKGILALSDFLNNWRTDYDLLIERNTDDEKKELNENNIDKIKKNNHVSFKEDFVEIINVESYKEYNVLNDKNEYLNNISGEENEESEDKEDENDEEKFDINKYDPMKLEKIPNSDPNGFSRTKCIIL